VSKRSGAEGRKKIGLLYIVPFYPSDVDWVI